MLSSRVLASSTQTLATDSLDFAAVSHQVSGWVNTFVRLFKLRLGRQVARGGSGNVSAVAVAVEMGHCVYLFSKKILYQD